MEIKSSSINTAKSTKQDSVKVQNENSDIKFSDELKDAKAAENKASENNKTENKETTEVSDLKPTSDENDKTSEKGKTEAPDSKQILCENNQKSTDKLKKEKNIEKPDKNENILENAIDNLTNVVLKLNQPEENVPELTKDNFKSTDNTDEDANLINNDFNIDNKDKLPQMLPNMNFGSDGQPFSSFMNNSTDEENKKVLTSTAQEIAEEAAILSTMAENIAMANKANVVTDSAEPEEVTEKTVIKEDGIKKIDTKNDIVKEVVVKYDTIIMNEGDVNVFADLVEGKEVNLNHISSESVSKSVHVSKTLADMLAKAMQDNKPVRIEFDNGISVIIKISKDGKLSADFLPSTQVAEAYLKENLPLLKQKFNEQNIEYDELNQRERRNPDREQNRKKGRENE